MIAIIINTKVNINVNKKPDIPILFPKNGALIVWII